MESIPPSSIWLIAGAAFIAVEVMGIPGIGFLFAGLAAVCVGALIALGVTEATSLAAQFAWFFALTTAWALLLWKPLKNWAHRKTAAPFTDIVGSEAVVGPAGLQHGAEGEIRWSGTTMKADLAPGSPEIPAGAKVRIVEVSGAKAIVTPL